MSVRQWADEEIFQLINIYAEKEFLWNVNHKLYRNRDKKISAQEGFGTKFNCDANEVERKIHNLRDQVSHELQKMKKLKSSDGADNRYDSKWKFFSALKFIVPCFTPTKTTSNMRLDNFDTTKKKLKRNSNKRQSQDDDNVLKEIIEIMKKLKDDFNRFGEYVALELKTLKSEYYRGLLKSKIRKSIANISNKDERNHWSRVMPSPSSTNTSSCSTTIPSPTVV